MITETQHKQEGKVDALKLRALADQLNNELPGGYGFALIIIEVDKQERHANYISNIHDDFMIKTLESHLFSLKHKKTFATRPANKILNFNFLMPIIRAIAFK